MPRGRLINILYATFLIEDPTTTVFDDEYSEPVEDRSNYSPVELPCQVEEPSWFTATFNYNGVSQGGEKTLILHYSDLEAAGLLDANRRPQINIGTKVTQLSIDSGEVITNFPDPPGMYVIEARDSSFGLSVDNNPTRNLLILLLSPREREVL